MPDIRFLVEMVKGVPVVAAPEEIDITNAGELRRALLESAAHGSGTLVVDLTRTQFCDTSGLHALVGARKRARAEGGDLLLVKPGAGVLRIFAITGLDQVFPSFATLDEALAHIAGGAGGASRDRPLSLQPPRFRDRATLPPDACGCDIAPVPAGHPVNF